MTYANARFPNSVFVFERISLPESAERRRRRAELVEMGIHITVAGCDTINGYVGC